MRHRQDHEIGLRQQLVERAGAVQLGHPRRRLRTALVDADDTHAEGAGEPRHLGADAADPDDQRGRLGQMHGAGVARHLLPLALQLLRQIDMQAAREMQHEGHDMRADMVVEDLPEIGDDDRVLDQLRIVVAGRRRDLRRLQPAQLLRPCQ